MENLAEQIAKLLEIARTDGDLGLAVDYLSTHAKKESGLPLHMWEAHHNYYMTDHSYWGDDTVQYYKNWEDFVDAEGDGDPDYNLIFRWDWKPVDDDDDYGEVQAKLHLYWATQRKGYFRTTITDVNKQDEPAVREWLHPRFEHLMKLWEPFVWVDDRIPDHNVREVVVEDCNKRKGACECCQYEHVELTPYDDQRERRKYDRHSGTHQTFDEGEGKIWLCALCASSWAGNSIQYPNQYEYAQTMQVICRVANSVMDKFDEAKDFDRKKLTKWLKENLVEMFEWQEEEPT